jgi:hypothetical protein
MKTEDLCASAREAFEAATNEVKQFDDPRYPSLMPTNSLNEGMKSISAINHEQVRAFEAAKKSVKVIFKDNIDAAIVKGDEALTRLNDRVSDIPAELFGAYPAASARARAYVREGQRYLRLAKMSDVQRIVASGLSMRIALISAAIVAVLYFVFSGSGVHSPLSGEGLQQVAQSASRIPAKLATSATESGSFIESITGTIKQLTELFSSWPLLLAALGGAIRATQKVWQV